MTRKDYIEGRVTHEEYYQSAAAEAGISWKNSADLPKVRAALAGGDEHLNTIPLEYWDAKASQVRGAIDKVLRLRGDSFSLAGGVSVMKTAAARAAREESREVTP